jgi:hypothetical protein
MKRPFKQFSSWPWPVATYLYNVVTFFSHENASGEYGHGVNTGAPCDRVQDFGEFANYRYSPLAMVPWVEM